MAYFLLSRSTLLVGTLWVTILIAGLPACSTLHPQPSPASPSPTSSIKQPAFFNTPLHFEANEGQTDRQVKFLSRGSGYGLYLTPQEAVLALRKPKPSGSEQETEETSPDFAVLRMRLVGANATPELTGDNLLPGKVNYFIGNDPAKWRTQIPTYGKIRYDNVYPGIDLLYYGNQRQLEYDFIVAPGEDPAQIAMAFEGTERLELDTQTGDLVLQTASGEVRQRKPLIYQEGEGDRQIIEGQYVIKDDTHVSFQVAAYDTTQPLIIDPILVFSTYLGGSGTDEGHGIVVDGRGQVYVTGETGSADFPTVNPFQTTLDGGDAYIAKLTADGSTLIYSTFLGGSDNEPGLWFGSARFGIAVDEAGHATIVGSTSSQDFPVVNALQPTLGGGTDAFVAQLTADGSALTFATYLGGNDNEKGNGIAIDGRGQIYVTGNTASADFPIYNPLQASNGGGSIQSAGGARSCAKFEDFSGDAFVVKLNADGSALSYATFLGGTGADTGTAITVDVWGQVSVTGETWSDDFPTFNPLQPTNTTVVECLTGPGFESDLFLGPDAFVAQLTTDGSALTFGTYLGGSLEDRGNGISMDEAGGIYVTGQTGSGDFPTQNPFDPSPGPGFVAKLTADGNSLAYSTYLAESGMAIAVDGGGRAAVTGTTIAQFTADGSALNFSTYLDGSGLGIALNSASQIYVTGGTGSADFPTTPNTVQPAFGGGFTDGFVTKIDPLRVNLNDQFAPLGPGDVSTSFSRTPCGGASAGTFTITASFTNTSANTLSNLLISVKTLTGGNMLCNANGGPGGAGAILTVPLQGDLSDSQLSPGETFTVQLAIGLQSFTPFQFLVDVLGEKD